MPRAKLTAKGQLTLPKELRNRLHLEVGDRIDFTVDEEGRLIGIPDRRAAHTALPGLLRHLAKAEPVSLEEMDRAIRQRYRTPDR